MCVERLTVADEVFPTNIFSDNDQSEAQIMGIIERAMEKIENPEIDEETRHMIRYILLDGLARQEKLDRALARLKAKRKK